MTQLSQLVDVQSIQADGTSLTLTTSGGAALVVGNQSFKLTTQTNSTTGFQDVFSQGKDITSSINGGNLAGDIQLRDQEIPLLQSSLDTLASGIANSVNTQHAAGFDLNGKAGGNIFVPPTGIAGSAINLAVAISDPNLIAASADGTAGNNDNATALANLQSQNIIAGQNPINYYSGIVFQVGNDASNASAGLSAEQLLRPAAAGPAKCRLRSFARSGRSESRSISERIRGCFARRKHHRFAVSNNHQHDRWLT